MRTWIIEEFNPVTLATPNSVIDQHIDSAYRYWNTHSAYKTYEMKTISTDGRVQCSKYIKTACEVYPATMTVWPYGSHPLWTLLGIQILDNITSDLIMMSQAYQNYSIYMGTDFRWWWKNSEDSTIGGYVYYQNVPQSVTELCVVGIRRIFTDEDLKTEDILDWILYYAKALTKVTEGNALRKSSIIGINNDGQQLVDEGKQEIEELQTRLAEEGRWFLLADRL